MPLLTSLRTTTVMGNAKPVVARLSLQQAGLFFTSSKGNPGALANTPPNSVKSSSPSPDRVEVSIDTRHGIAHVFLNRPDKLNALDMKMFEAIQSVGQQLRSDRALRVVILAGRGRAFSTGLDVKSMVQTDVLTNIERMLHRPEHQLTNLAQEVAYQWRELPVPVIAALHGICYGGALQIALGADVRLAEPSCRVSVMEAKWGLIPDMSASLTLRELVRMDVAKELTMTGRVLPATEAAALGLVTRCVPDPLASAQELALEMVQRSPDALANAKKLYQSTWVASEEYCLRVETDLQRQLLKTWNQLAASGRAFGWKIPYFRRRKDGPTD